MILRVGFVVAASVAAYAIRIINVNGTSSEPQKPEIVQEKDHHVEGEVVDGQQKDLPLGIVAAASVAAYAIKVINVKGAKSETKITEVTEDEAEAEKEKDKERELPLIQATGVDEGEEKVKLISSIFDRVLESSSFNDEEYLPEFDALLSGEIDFPLHDIADKQQYEEELSNNAVEIQRLRDLVLELQEREVKFEGELLEYYGLKAQESDVASLHNQLQMKSTEIEMMNHAIATLEHERKMMSEAVAKQEQLKTELESSRKKIKELQGQIELDASQTKGQLLLLKEQVNRLKLKEEEALRRDAEVEKRMKELEIEVAELKRKNKELQHEKRELVMKLETSLTEAYEREEVSELKHANDDLVKQVEGLQVNRFSEVEELVYLRWVNACLRYELRNYHSPSEKLLARDLNKGISFRSQEKAKQLMMEYASSERGLDTDIESNVSIASSAGSEDFDNSSVESGKNKKTTLIQKLRKLGRSKDDFSDVSRRRSLTKGALETLMIRNADENSGIVSYGTSEGVASSFQLMSKSNEGVMESKYPAYKDRHRLAVERERQIKEKAHAARAARFNAKEKPFRLPPVLSQIDEKSVSDESLTVNKIKVGNVERRAPRVPRPPPKPSGTHDSLSISPSSSPIASPSPRGVHPPSPLGMPRPPPPPPPPPGTLPRRGDNVHRAPELVEFYQTLMKREAKNSPSMMATSANVLDARSNMIGEIENRSTFLLEVKADVETQGEFVQSLAAEVRAASFSDIVDLLAFVNWLDEELSFLVDERAVLKHFDWPEGKTDALREAAFEYQDLKKLEKHVTFFSDDVILSYESALDKMYKLLEKVENSVYALLRTRDMAISKYRDFGIPVDWLSDSGVVGKIKLGSVQLARKYMKRVAAELDAMSGQENEHEREFLVLQGVRFAFRVHQFAGGFDAESMKAFEELRSRVTSESEGMGENNL